MFQPGDVIMCKKTDYHLYVNASRNGERLFWPNGKGDDKAMFSIEGFTSDQIESLAELIVEAMLRPLGFLPIKTHDGEKGFFTVIRSSN